MRSGLCPAKAGGVLLFVIWVAFGGPLLAADDFPPITEEERQLTEVDWDPGASAVVLLREGVLRFVGAQGTKKSSILTVRVRLKVLTEAGREEAGEFKIVHNESLRLKEFRGRTVLPDGGELPLSEESIFRRRSSRSQGMYLTTAAFPGVVVGAILDYRYEIEFKSVFHLDPWEFQSTIPTLRSRITYHVPQELRMQIWRSDPLNAGIQSQTDRGKTDGVVNAWAERLPAITDEPYSRPRSDFIAKIMLVPVRLRGVNLFSNWSSTCGMVRGIYYAGAEHKSKEAKRKAKRLVADLKVTAQRQRAERLYRFVRDRIETVPRGGVLLTEKQTLNKVIKERKGDYADKGLLLAFMLRAVDIPVSLVWAANRRAGTGDLDIANPLWFDRILVRLTIKGEALVLDPSAPELPFGALLADYEGTKALVCRHTPPQVIVLPEVSWRENRKLAELSLKIDDEGRLSGTGKLLMTGHSAQIHFANDGKPAESWREWLEERMGDYEISDVVVAGEVDEGRLEVQWRMEEHLEGVLGDEVSLSLSRPLGPVEQRFTIPADERRSTVVLDFGKVNEVKISLAWPPGWEVDLTPGGVELESQVGAYRLAVDVDEARRSLRVSRRMEIHSSHFKGRKDYAHLQELWSQAAKGDAQALVLVRH